MKRTFSYWYIQQRQKGCSKTITLGHSENKKTGEVLYKFCSKKDAIELMSNEKNIKPEYEYRAVKVTETIDEGQWN